MPLNVTVDLKTRFIAETTRVYILFPGNGYKFYQFMEEAEGVFLDIPGFPLDGLEDADNITDSVARLTVSERIREWHELGRKDDMVPARDVKSLGRYRSTPAKIQFAGLIRGFFSNIKTGDIVIVPSPDYDQDVLFGEVEDGSTVYEFTIPRYGDDITPGKSVKWIKRVRRSNIPGWLNGKFASPNPLRQLEQSEHNYVFDTMYERYFVDGQFVCKFRIDAEEFSALDDFLFKQIVLYAAALHENIHEDNIKDISKRSISEVVSELDFSEDIPDQRIMINSPGYIVIYSKNLIPIVAAVLMTMAASQPPLQAGELAQPQVSIVNSADDSQVAAECSADVQSEVLEDLNAMGYERWRELCTIEHQARRRTQLSPGMVAQPGIHGASGQTR